MEPVDSLNICEIIHSIDKNKNIKIFNNNFKAFCDGINAYIIGKIENSIVLAFRGTLSINDDTKPISQRYQDWKNDFNKELIKTNDFEGMIHSGFYKSFSSMWKSILENVKLIGLKDITLIGHSKGGSVVLLIAYRLKKLGYNVNIQTFGAPKVGNVEFVDSIKDIPIERYEVANDIVPFWPEDNYVSAGELKYITSNGIKSDSHFLSGRRKLSIYFKILTLRFSKVFAAHDIDNYSNYLLNLE